MSASSWRFESSSRQRAPYYRWVFLSLSKSAHHSYRRADGRGLEAPKKAARPTREGESPGWRFSLRRRSRREEPGRRRPEGSESSSRQRAPYYRWVFLSLSKSAHHSYRRADGRGLEAPKKAARTPDRRASYSPAASPSLVRNSPKAARSSITIGWAASSVAMRKSIRVQS